jgi:hypothetical protein
MDNITIPPKALEAGTKAIAKRNGCDRAVFSVCISAEEAGVPCRCAEDAHAACLAMLKNWPGMRVHQPSVPPRPPAPRAAIILPLTEPSDGK